jgi:hypothetical protein
MEKLMGQNLCLISEQRITWLRSDYDRKGTETLKKIKIKLKKII